jgi:biuret amidohydrolase
VERTFGLDIPLRLEEACNPWRMALIVYDMQVGIMSQLPHGPEVTAKVGEILGAAREGGFPVFFSRHMSLPKELMGLRRTRTSVWPSLSKAWKRSSGRLVLSNPDGPARGRDG